MTIKQWLLNLLGKQTDTKPTDIQTGNLQADKGSVVVGQATDGTQIAVYNLSVSKETIAAYAQQLSLPKAKAEKITRDYLLDIETYYRYLPLKGMGDNSGLRLRFPLVKLFVPLNARLTLPRGDTLPDALRIAGRAMSEEERENVGGKLDKPQPILNLFNDHSVLVILGDPGSGKSTIVRFMAYVLATGQGQSFALAGYLPLLLPLSAYSEKLSHQSGLSLRKFATDYFHERMDTHHLDHLLDHYLQRGKVLILLDGLDEVKEIGQRNIVVDRVQVFLSRYVRDGNRVILTSRIIGYREVRPPEIAGLRECTLLDFEQDEIETFIHRWTQVIESQAYEEQRIADYQAKREADDLIASIEQNNAVLKLAANPLLLTMLVIQKRQGGELPRHRVLLYERYITSLLHDWQLARNIHATACELPNERALRRILEPLAAWLHESEPGKGLVAEMDLLRWLKQQSAMAGDNADDNARQFIRDVRENSGLLIDRGGQKFGFLHLTFMEYLAAVSLANKIQHDNGLREVIATVQRYADVSEWREVLLLNIGYIGLQQRQEITTTKLLQQLLSIKDDAGAVKSIAAEALSDIGEDGVTPESWQSFKQSLLDNGVYNAKVASKYRASIGRSLGLIGDPRSLVNNVDAMPFCYVPAGEFFMGRGEFDQEGEEWKPETPAGTYDLNYGYWMARYPVTSQQFLQFIDATNYDFDYKKYLYRALNAPVAVVSWADAMQFCHWLTQRWQQAGSLPQDWCVTLPDEAEWEKAARGGVNIPLQPQCWQASKGKLSPYIDCAVMDNLQPQRRYSWGNEIEHDYLNFNDNIGFPSTAELFPLGQSPYGCQDMAGNIWEWTRSELGDYPYPAMGTEEWQQRRDSDKSEEAFCVLRGGAFFNLHRSVRCAVRRYYRRGSRNNSVGFRVILSPLL